MRGEDAKGVQRELLSKEVTLTNPAILEANARMNQRTGSIADFCNRDYAAPCPDGWQVAGKQCVAPKGYSGGCKTLQRFDGFDALERGEFARECDAPWPCKDTCARDWAQLCPAGWDDVGAGFCESEAGDVGSCSNRYNFDGFSIDQKERLAKVCDFTWPCVVPCHKDYEVQCPEGWSQAAGGMCVAPGDYAGECDFGFNATGVSSSQKLALEDKCAVQYPCQRGGATDADKQQQQQQQHGAEVLVDGPVDATGEIIGAPLPVIEQPIVSRPGQSAAEADASTMQYFRVVDGPVNDAGDINRAE